MTAELYYRIGTSAATLATGGNLFARGLPIPRQAIYNDHSGRRPMGQGGEGRHGYINASLLWDALTVDQASIIRALIATAETSSGNGNGTLWATIPKTTAQSSGIEWIDVSGIAIMPQWIPEERVHGLVYENVVLRLNDCTVEAEPSTILDTDLRLMPSETVSVAESITVSVS